MFLRPSTSFLPDLKAAFDSIGRAILWRCLPLKGVLKKSISLSQSLYAKSRSRADDLPAKFTITSSVRQDCIFRLFSLILSLKLPYSHVKTAESTFVWLGIWGPSCAIQWKLNCQVFFDRLNYGVFGIRFAPSKSKTLLQDWSDSKQNFVLAEERLIKVERFCYFNSYISPGAHKGKVSSCVSKARISFTNFRHW